MKTIVFSILLCFTMNAFSEDIPRMISLSPDVGIYEHLGIPVTPTIKLKNEKDSLVTLNDIIKKPTVLSFAYFDCHGLCTAFLNGISDLIDKSGLKIGTDYQVITVSLTDEDKPETAMMKKEEYLKKHPGISQDSWVFLTGDSANIQSLCDLVGFKFSRIGKDFTHAPVLVLFSPNGTINRYLFGIDIHPPDFKVAILDMAKGQVKSDLKNAAALYYPFDGNNKHNTRISEILFVLLIVLVCIVGIVWLTKSRNRQMADKGPYRSF